MDIEFDNSEADRECESFRYYRIFRTVLEIMEYRHFFVPEESKKMDFLEFNNLYEQQLILDKNEAFA